MKIFEGLFATKPKSVYRFIDEGNIDAIRNYLNKAKDLNPDLKLENILYYAIDNCQNNYFKTIELLINNGADIKDRKSVV